MANAGKNCRATRCPPSSAAKAHSPRVGRRFRCAVATIFISAQAEDAWRVYFARTIVAGHGQPLKLPLQAVTFPAGFLASLATAERSWRLAATTKIQPLRNAWLSIQSIPARLGILPSSNRAGTVQRSFVTHAEPSSP